MNNINNLLGGGDSDNSDNSDKYNKKTYIGYLKMKNGGMKIIPGEKDDKIISKRNKILRHLDVVLSGGKRLKEKNIEKYFNALGGKYVRNDLCSSGDKSNCKGGKSVSVEGAHKLLKLISKKSLPIDNALDTFRGSAPELYEKLEDKIKGGYNAISYDDYNGGIDERASGSRSRALKEAEKIHPITNYYPDERIGGYDDRNYYPNERRGGYERDYYSDNRNGGSMFSSAMDFAKRHAKEIFDKTKDEAKEQFKNTLSEHLNKYGGDYDYGNMSGGDDNELNKFRQDIGRYTFSLRNEILNMNL